MTDTSETTAAAERRVRNLEAELTRAQIQLPQAQAELARVRAELARIRAELEVAKLDLARIRHGTFLTRGRLPTYTMDQVDQVVKLRDRHPLYDIGPQVIPPLSYGQVRTIAANPQLARARARLRTKARLADPQS